MTAVLSFTPEEIEISPYTKLGARSLRIIHKPTMLQVCDENDGDYHKTRDRLLEELDHKVSERYRQTAGFTIVELLALIAIAAMVGVVVYSQISRSIGGL